MSSRKRVRVVFSPPLRRRSSSVLARIVSRSFASTGVAPQAGGGLRRSVIIGRPATACNADSVAHRPDPNRQDAVAVFFPVDQQDRVAIKGRGYVSAFPIVCLPGRSRNLKRTAQPQ